MNVQFGLHMKKWTMDIRFAQINMGRSNCGMHELRRLMDTQSLTVALIQEPFLRGHLQWPGFRTYYLSTDQTPSWVLTVIRMDSPPGVLLAHLSSPYCVVVRVERDQQRIFLVNCYFRYADPIAEHLAHLDRVLLALRGEPVFICADVNAKSTLWFNPTTDLRGEQVDDFVLAHDLHIANIASPYTTFESAQGTSNIDVTLITPNLRRHVYDWHIDPDTLLSDHRLIRFNLSSGPRPQHVPQSEPNVRLQDIDWRSFDATLLVDTESLVSFDEAPLPTKIETITQLLQRACAESAVRKGRPRATARWWIRDLDLARSEKLSHERRWKRLRTRHGADDPRTMEAHALFSRARTRYVNKIRHTKRESWIRCVQLGSNSDPWGTAYKILAGRYKALPPLVSLRVDQQVTITKLSG